MPSRADFRRVAEWALRVALIALLAIALWESMRKQGMRGAVIAATSKTLDTAIARSLTRPDAHTMALAVEQSPTPTQRELLVALRRAGVSVAWSGAMAPVAVQVVRDRDPLEGSTVRIAGGANAVLRDSAGVIDTLRNGMSALGVTTALVGGVSAVVGTTTARANIPHEPPRRSVLVLGRADWESKFVISALGESGWQVRARIPAAPGVDIRDDALLPIDTSRYDAVVALDTSAAVFANDIVRFVRDGGGLVIAGNALSNATLRDVAPASASARLPGRILLTEDTVTRRDLPITPLDNMRHDAVRLERQPSGIALAARRAGQGRVLALGYDESWRWRMLGGESGLSSHRDWWSRMVASVSAERGDSVPAGVDAAPRVAMLTTLGAATAALPRGVGASSSAGLPVWMLLVAIAALIGEIASRRLRGER